MIQLRWDSKATKQDSHRGKLSYLQSSSQDQRSAFSAGGTAWSNCAGQAAVHSTATCFSAGGSMTQPSPSAQMPTHHRNAGSLQNVRLQTGGNHTNTNCFSTGGSIMQPSTSAQMPMHHRNPSPCTKFKKAC